MNLLRKLKTTIAVQKLSPMARSVRKERLTYLSPEKMLRLEQGLREVRGIAGDFLEFGVALGGSSIVIATAAKAQARLFAGYDVFATIPPPTSDKDDDKARQRYAVISEGKSKGLGGDQYYGYHSDLYGEVTRSFQVHGLPVDGDKIRLVKGLFEETWPDQGSDKIAFVHLDCDWYEPVRYCLDAVADRLSPGGIIMLDDYHDYGGCRTATEEFRAKRQDFRFEDAQNPALRKLH